MSYTTDIIRQRRSATGSSGPTKATGQPVASSSYTRSVIDQRRVGASTALEGDRYRQQQVQVSQPAQVSKPEEKSLISKAKDTAGGLFNKVKEKASGALKKGKELVQKVDTKEEIIAVAKSGGSKAKETVKNVVRGVGEKLGVAKETEITRGFNAQSDAEKYAYSEREVVPLLRARIQEIDEVLATGKPAKQNLAPNIIPIIPEEKALNSLIKWTTGNATVEDKLKREKQYLEQLISGEVDSMAYQRKLVDEGKMSKAEYDKLVAEQRINQAQVLKGQRASASAAVGFAKASAGLAEGGQLIGDQIGNETLSRRSKEFADQVDQWAEVSDVKDKSGLEKVMEGAGSALYYYFLGSAIGKVAGAAAGASPRISSWFAATAGGGSEALAEAGAVYRDNLRQGLSKEEAMKKADAVFGANVLMNIILERYGIRSDEANGIKRVLLAAPAEGIQEGMQQVISNTGTGRPWDEGVIESGILGGIIGSGIAVATSGEVQISPQELEEVRQIVEDETDIEITDQTVPQKLGVMDATENVPVNELDKYKEFDRSQQPYLSKEEYEQLREDIKQNGIKNPVVIQYNYKDKTAKITEGNHRLAIAKELGIKTIPTRVEVVDSYKGIYRRGQLAAVPVEDFELDQNQEIPEYLKPSDIIKTDQQKGEDKTNERDFAFDQDSTTNEGRFALGPSQGYERFYRKPSGTDGVSLVVGVKPDGSETVQALRFKKEQFSEEQAREWWEQNKTNFSFAATEKKAQTRKEPSVKEEKSAPTEERGTGKGAETETVVVPAEKPGEARPGTKKSTSKLAQYVREQLGAEINPDEIRYQGITLDGAAERAVDIVNNNPQLAQDIIDGFVPAPNDTTRAAIMMAAAETARKAGDTKTQAELIKQRFFMQNRYGQEIVTERLVNDLSTDRFIKDVLAARLANVVKKQRVIFGKVLSQATNKIATQTRGAKKKVDKHVMTKISSAQEIINELMCK